MLQRMVGAQKINWHLKLYSTLLAYRTIVKNATSCTPSHLVYSLEVVLPIECGITSFNLAIELFPNTTSEEERFLYLTQFDESHQNTALKNDAHK